MTAAGTVERRRLPAAVPVAIALAWAAAVAAHATGVADRFHHDALLAHGGLGLAGVGGYALVWCVMVAAMMLPSAVPLLRLFAEGVGPPGAARPAAGLLRRRVPGGVGAVRVGGAGVRRRRAPPGPRPALAGGAPWLVGAATLGLAGAFQFSSLKDRCLTACRHPAAYLLRHYRRGPAAAFRLGWGHGLYCLGCCWALMLVMFAVGVTDLRWMAALAALMAYEKIGRHGQAVAAAAGVVALALALLVALHPAWMPPFLTG